ncbi:MAG: PHP domain-containing protein [Clostridia bacterium]|nr:PHP domain-containing protein [Clostridia bacterium]
MKIDLHVHTSEVSLCGHLSAEETVQRYKAAGYDCIVITDHFNSYTKGHYERAGVTDFFRHYHDSYLHTKEEGEKAGLTVLGGYEIRFDGADSDYLVYGMSDATASRTGELFAMSPREFFTLAEEEGFLFYQAHPFRNNMRITDPNCLFGIEIKNGNVRHDNRNDIAKAWAEKFGLHKIAGSDCHQIMDVGVSGITTGATVSSIEDLLRILREDDYEII